MPASRGVPANRRRIGASVSQRLDKIFKRETNLLAKKYRVHKLKKPLDSKKKLLVLDLDHTLIHTCDERSKSCESLRPYLRSFLRKAYKKYNLVLWSASNITRIRKTMKRLGISTHSEFRFSFYLCNKAVLHNVQLGQQTYSTKPLQVIWKEYRNFGPKNTIMIDDLPRNFLMNPQSGLVIKAYNDCDTAASADEELRLLSMYLNQIAKVDDFRELHHAFWRLYTDG